MNPREPVPPAGLGRPKAMRVAWNRYSDSMVCEMLRAGLVWSKNFNLDLLLSVLFFDFFFVIFRGVSETLHVDSP